jgi:hypothetical protein
MENRTSFVIVQRLSTVRHDKLHGKDKAIFAARDQKLASARLQRKINHQNQPAHSVTHTTVFSN